VPKITKIYPDLLKLDRTVSVLFFPGHFLSHLGPSAPSRFSVELDQVAAVNWFTATARCTVFK